MIGVYKFTNKFNRKVYVGKSVHVEKRYKEHKHNLNKDINNLLYNAIRKYGIENFDFDVLIECPKENLDYWEKFYIRYYCSNDKKYGYNMTIGGDGKPSDYWTNELRQEYSDMANERYNNNPEIKDKISISVSNYYKENPYSEEQKSKNREATLNYYNNVENHKLQSERVKKSFTKERREKWSEMGKKRYEDPNEREKDRQALLNYYKTHDSPTKNYHRVYDDLEHKKYHMEKNA